MGQILNREEIINMFISDKKSITDPTAQMPFIGVSRLKAGANKELALLYALRAFRADLYMVDRTKSKLNDVITRRESNETAEEAFFRRDHKLFYALIRRYVVKENNKAMYSVLNQANMDVFKHNGSWVFKDSETGFMSTLEA